MSRKRESFDRKELARFLGSGLVLFLALVGLDCFFRGIYSMLGEASIRSGRILLAFTGGWAGFFALLTMALPAWPRRILTVVLGLLFVILALVHGGMYSVFSHVFSFSDLNFLGDGAAFFSWDYIHLRKLLILGLAGISGAVIAAAWLVPRRKWHPAQLCALVLAAVCLLPIDWGHRALMPAEKDMTWSKPYDARSPEALYKSFNDPNRCLSMLGLYQYTARDLYKTLVPENHAESWQTLDAYFDLRATQLSGDTEMTGAFAGKNCIMVMLESVDTWLLTPEIMPNLYGVQQESIQFTRFYTPLFLNAATFCTEFTSLTGLIPPTYGFGSSGYSTNSYPLALPRLFAREGYAVNSYHGSAAWVYSRGTVHENLGFEAYHDGESMNMEHYMLDSGLIHAFDDIDTGEPFFRYLITYSCHGPYNQDFYVISDPHLEEARAVAAASGVTGTEENLSEYTYAIAQAMETDLFIGELMELLEQTGLAENTVVLFYTDHYGKYITDREFLARLKGENPGSNEMYRTPCFLWSRDQAPRQVEKVTSTMDLLPTMVKLFSLDADCRYFVGDDMFGDQGNFAPLPGYGYVTAAGTEVAAEVHRKVDMSNLTMTSNYFAGWEE